MLHLAKGFEQYQVLRLVPTDAPDAPDCRALVERIQAQPLIGAMLEAIPGIAMLVDPARRVVAANRRLLQVVGVESVGEVLGCRLGEAIGCDRACKMNGVCGIAAECAVCGATQALINTQRTGLTTIREASFLLELGKGASMEAEVVAAPLQIGNVSCTIISMRDISSDKRRQMLERVFFHDILDTAGGLHGLSQMLLEQGDHDAQQELKKLLTDLSERLIDIINVQRQLVQAEAGDLILDPRPASVSAIVAGVHGQYVRHDCAKDRSLVVGSCVETTIVTDVKLLHRVLGNMVKNALEATPAGATITLTAIGQPDAVRFEVHNPGAMDTAVKHHIFQRSFSTKGSGRGIGTYSIRLLGERYLGGSVAFTSEQAEGTRFSFIAPKEWSGRQA